MNAGGALRDKWSVAADELRALRAKVRAAYARRDYEGVVVILGDLVAHVRANPVLRMSVTDAEADWLHAQAIAIRESIGNARRAGDHEGAIHAAEAGIERVGANPKIPISAGHLERDAGLAAERLQRPAEALRWYRRAQSTFVAEGVPPDEVLTRKIARLDKLLG